MNTFRKRRLIRGGAAMLVVLCSGCASTGITGSALFTPGNIHIYPPFDNSRDGEPSYLVGPPGHHFGYGTRVDDNRSSPPGQ